MGTIFSIWGPSKKSGKTVFTYLLANKLIKLSDSKLNILIVCANLSYGDIYELIEVSTSEVNFEDIVNFKLNKNEDINYKSLIPKNKGIYFLGTRKTTAAYISRNVEVYKMIFEEFKSTFDIILVDTVSGSDNLLTNLILNISDEIIQLLIQDISQLKSFKKNDRDIAYFINNYMNIYPKEKDFESKFGISPLYTLERNELLQDLKNKGNLDGFMDCSNSYNDNLNNFSTELLKKFNFKVEKNIETVPVKKIWSLFGGKHAGFEHSYK